MWELLVDKFYRLGIVLNYKWCMANAYLTQDYAPVVSRQWESDADKWLLELWRFDRTLR